MSIDLSIVVTLYNKEPYIANTLTSLRQDTGGLNVEYILVDDVSTDRTVAIVETMMRDLENVTIVRNTTNRGPSVRINQGIRLSRGKYVFCFDSDDIATRGALRKMYDLLEAHDADVIYGKWEKTESTGKELLSRELPEHTPYKVSDSPLEFVLQGRFLRMLMMARRDVFEKSGGADERIFIQDESIPLRLAAYAKRFIALDAVVMLVPKIEGALSRNRSQLNHDRFLANYYMLADNQPASDLAKRLLYRRCISAAWKQKRQERGKIRSLFDPLFPAYLKSRKPGAAIDDALLHQLYGTFASLTNVRRSS